MKVAILDARQGKRDPSKSNTVAYRNMLIIKNLFDADFYYDTNQLKKSRDDYEAIICGFGSTSTEREESTNFLIKNKKAQIFWLVGEYEQSTFAPIFYSKKPIKIIKNFEHETKNKQSIEEYFLNINTLLLDDKNEPKIHKKKYANIYYGRWRENRSMYINKYLNKECYLSTSPKNMKIFLSQCPSTKKSSFVKNLLWEKNNETLKLFSTSLYLEDVYTHSHYNCPANRYYEAINCGVIMLTQVEAKNTWDRSGIKGIPEISSHDEYTKLSEEIHCDKKIFRDHFDRQLDLYKSAKITRGEVLESLRHIILSER